MEIISVTKKEAAAESLALMVKYWKQAAVQKKLKRKKKKQPAIGTKGFF